MTLLERLRIIGRGNTKKTGKPQAAAKPKEKGILGTSFDLFTNPNSLVNETRASKKLLQANEGWVYKNNDVIAKEVSGIEFELYTLKQVGKELEFDPILQHPLLDALDRFNDFTSASDGFYMTQSHKTLAGDAFWYIERNELDIKGIYLLQPDKVELKLGRIQAGQKVVQAYEFKDSIQGEQVEVTYKARDIVHFKNPNPENPYRGKSKVEAAAETIDTDNYAIEANKGQFKRGFINNFVMTTDKSMTDDQVKGLEARLRKYTGALNAFRIPIFSGGLKPESIQLTSRDMEFIAQQTWNRDKIMSIFGNNRAVLGITDDVNRSNADATILNWKRTTIKSEMKAICDTLNEFFVPIWGDNLILGFKDPVPEDKNEKVDLVTKLKNADIVSINEAREEMGYDPVDGGDEMGFERQERQQAEMAKQNAQNMKEPPKPVKNVNYMAVVRKSSEYKKAIEFGTLKQEATAVAKKLIKQRPKAQEEKPEVREHSTFTNEKVWGFHSKQIHIVESHEDIFRTKVQQFLDGLLDRAIASVPAEISRMQNKALLNETDEVTRATIDFTPILNEVALLSGQQALSLIGNDDPYIGLDVRTVIERNVKKFATSMIETDRNLMIDIITEGVVNGDSVAKIRKAITTKFAEYSKMQAERITRTEVIRASNYGALDAWKQTDVVVAKQWLTALDDRVDPLCNAMNGTVIPVNKNFFDKGDNLEVGDATAQFDYGSVKVPPLHPNCRCTLLPVLAQEESFNAKAYLNLAELKKLRDENIELKGYVTELEDFLDA